MITSKITEKQLIDYMKCPVYYYFRYANDFTVSETQSFNKLLSKVASGFFLQLMNNKIMPMYDVKRKWDMISKANTDIINSKRNIEGLGLLNAMYNWAANRELRIASEQMPYIYEINNGSKNPADYHIISLSGVMNTIMVNEKDNLEFLVLDFSSKIREQADIDLDLKVTIDCAVFEKKYGKRILGCRWHSVKHNKDFYTTRNAMDYQRLDKILKNVVKSIRQNIIYPRSSPLCSSCRAKHYCKGWS
jgi:hypothetical protein